MFDEIRKFIFWLKGIFAFRRNRRHRKSKKAPAEIEMKTKPILDSHIQEKKKEPSPGGNETFKELEKPPPVPPLKNKLPEATEVQEPEAAVQEAEKPQQPKRPPRTKKLPTEERTIRKSSNRYRMPRDRPVRKPIDLGERKTRRRKTTKSLPADSGDTRKDRIQKAKELPLRIQSPFIELNLDEAKVILVMPEQTFQPKDTTINIPKELTYNTKLNDEEHSISARVIQDDHNTSKVEEIRLEVEQPLQELHINFPPELQNKEFTYKHGNRALYAFLAVGNSRARMHWLYNSQDGGINAIPQRSVWLLVKEKYQVQPGPDMVEETWVWETYQPLHIDLSDAAELNALNSETEQAIKIPCEPNFSIVGESLASDDYKDDMPLLTGEYARVLAPRVNPSGWVVWVQNKQAGHRVINCGWTGDEPLEIKFPDDLPCEWGEFQVDVCEQDEQVPAGTLFFRNVPLLSLKQPSDLIVPHPSHGHEIAVIDVVLSQNSPICELNCSQRILIIERGWRIELPSSDDTVRFSVASKGKPETMVCFKVTVPRLRWKTSKQKGWVDKPSKLKREELISGQDLYLSVRTNERDGKYDVSATLEAGTVRLQEARLVQERGMYRLGLNQFYDTIKAAQKNIKLKLNITDRKTRNTVAAVDCLYFGQPKKQDSTKPSRIAKRSASPPMPRQAQLRSIEARSFKVLRPTVKKCGGSMEVRRGRGFSMGELEEAGILGKEVVMQRIYFDKRRKTTHAENVATLRSLTQEVRKNANRSS